MPDSIDLVGYFAAIIISVAYVPQAVLVWRNDDTRSISLGMYALMVFGIGVWLTYGILLNSSPLITANLFMFTVAGSILWKKVSHIRVGK